MSLKRLTTCFLLLMILSPIPLPALVISGTDLFPGTVREALASELEGRGITATFEMKGSLLGLQSLEEGSTSVSLIAVPEGTEDGISFRQFPVAFQVAALAVNESNPVGELSYDQLRRIFGPEAVYEKWSALTSDPAWSDRSIERQAVRLDDTISLELFATEVLGGGAFTNTLRFARHSPEEHLQAVAGNPNAIFLIPALEVRSPAKLLAIQRTEGQPAYGPSPDNVFFGDYPLRLPFNLAVSPELEPAILRNLLEAIYSPAVTQALLATYFVPVPERDRRGILAEID